MHHFSWLSYTVLVFLGQTLTNDLTIHFKELKVPLNTCPVCTELYIGELYLYLQQHCSTAAGILHCLSLEGMVYYHYNIIVLELQDTVILLVCSTCTTHRMQQTTLKAFYFSSQNRRLFWSIKALKAGGVLSTKYIMHCHVHRLLMYTN